MNPPPPSAFHAVGFEEEEARRRAALCIRVADALGSGRPVTWYHVPGRIEILGKHTDYAGGRSLVCATEQGMAAAVVPRGDATIRIVDAASGQAVESVLDRDTAGRRGHWGIYPATVAARLARDFGPGLRGVDLAFCSDLPPAAGLSSSSALIVAVALAVLDRNGLRRTTPFERELSRPELLAGYLGAVENGRPFGSFAGGGGVGTLGGSQDHTAIVAARAGMLLQCRFDPPLLEREVAWPPDLTFLVAASGVAAEKTGGALGKYNALARTAAELSRRMALSAEGEPVPSIGRRIIDAGQPARLTAQLRARLGDEDPGVAEPLADRLGQLVAECRVHIPGMVAALERSDLAEIGRLAAASHELGGKALRNLIVETRALAEMALEGGAVAASAFGAGFGGSVWAIVERGAADRVLEEWRSRYLSAFPERRASATFLQTRPGPAALMVTGGAGSPGR